MYLGVVGWFTTTLQTMKDWRKDHQKRKALRFNGIVSPGHTCPHELLEESPLAEQRENVLTWDTLKVPKITKLLHFRLLSVGGEAA